MKLSVITDQLYMDFEKSVYELKKLGISNIEIHSLWNKTIEELDDTEIKKAEEIICKYKMKVSCLSTTLFLMTPLYTNINKLEKFSNKFKTFNGSYKEHISKLEECIEMSKRFDTNFIRVFPFRREGGVNKNINEVINDISDKFRDLVKLLEKGNKILIMENCPYTYLPKVSLTNKVVEKVESNNLKLLFDFGNNFKSNKRVSIDEYKINVFEDYHRAKENIVYCHVKDYKKEESNYIHVGFAKGDVGCKEIIRELNKNQFKFFISLESEVDYKQTITSICDIVKFYRDEFE